MTRAASIFCALALCACSERSAIQIDLAFAKEAKSVVFMSEVKGERRAFAVDPALAEENNPEIFSLSSYDGSFKVRFFALLYDETLNELGLSAGPIEEAPNSSGTFPKDYDLYVREISGDDDGDWTESATTAPEVDSFRSERLPKRCRRLGGRGYFLQTLAPVRAIVPHEEDGVLLFTSDDDLPPPVTRSSPQIYRVGAEGPLRVDESIPNFSDDFGSLFLTTAAAGAENAEIFVATSSHSPNRNDVWLGTLNAGFQKLPERSNVTTPIRFMKAHSNRLFVLSEGGGIEVFDRQTQTWTELKTGSGRQTCSRHPLRYCGGFAAKDDTLWALVPGDASRIYRYRDGELNQEEQPSGPPTGAPMTLVDTALGPLLVRASIQEAMFFVRTDEGWGLLERAQPTQRPYVAVAYEDGFIFSGEFGYATEYDQGFCPFVPGAAAGLDAGLGAAFRGGLVFSKGIANHSASPSGTTIAVVKVELN